MRSCCWKKTGLSGQRLTGVEAFRTIQRNGQHLLGLVNDFLDLSKIEAGKMSLEFIECKTCRVISETVSLMQHRAQQKDLALSSEFVGPIPETIGSDPTRLKQILVNLIGNAIKFTNTGSVRVITTLGDLDDVSSPHIRFEVVDTGVGISDEGLSKLFKPFTQADTSTTRKFGGTGLGLSICRRLATMLGGDITVSSTLGQGSSFIFTVATGPLDGVRIIENMDSGTQAKAVVPQNNKSLRTSIDCRILLAEDGLDNQRLISFVLKKAGASVTVAENGLIAYNMAMQALDSADPFDIIFDGHANARTRRLRSH